jgi:glutathione S-transferase
MKLYYMPGACSLSPHIVLRETGADFQLVKVDGKTKKTESGEDFLAINPNGYVPALQLDDGSVLTEGPAIVQYLADRAPATKLAPNNGTVERYQLQSVLNFVSTELHKQYSPLFDKATPEDVRKAQLARLAKRYDYVEKRLSAQPFITGAQFTVADAYLFTVTNWAGHVKLDLSPWPKLQDYQKRLSQRPSVQAALKAEGLAK